MSKEILKKIKEKHDSMLKGEVREDMKGNNDYNLGVDDFYLEVLEILEK